MKQWIKFYLILGIGICGLYSVAAARGWKAPDFGIVKALNSPSSGVGRSYGGSWGGGK